MDSEQMNGKLSALKIKPADTPDVPQQQNPNKLNRLAQNLQQQQQMQFTNYQTNPAFNEINTTTNKTRKQSITNQEQLLDNSAIQHLVSEQTKAHLILDDAELLQCKSAQEFIALFRNKLLIQQNQELATNETTNRSDPLTKTEQSNKNKNTNSNTSPQLSPNSQMAEDKLVKCVAIFGNTGDGKSHTLNHTFFNGRSIFTTSNRQETCTMGVWCAYDQHTNSLIFDTEGLLGTTSNENKRMRLLLKVLAISDVIIYRTRAERLHNDLFKFLSDASVAYLKYFR